MQIYILSHTHLKLYLNMAFYITKWSFLHEIPTKLYTEKREISLFYYLAIISVKVVKRKSNQIIYHSFSKVPHSMQ